MSQQNIHPFFRTSASTSQIPIESNPISSPQNDILNPPQNIHPSYHPLAPPPELTYTTKQDLFQAIQSWAKSHGYAISIKNSNAPSQRYTYHCDKSGEYVPKNPKTQLGATRKTNCPFRITGNFYKKLGLWKVKVLCPDHNHPPSEDPSTHSIHRKIPKNQIETVNNLAKAGVPPLKILNTLIQSSSQPIHTNLNTIYHERAKIYKDYLNGKSPIEALILELRNSSFIYKIENIEGHISSLFISHPDSIRLAKQFPTVLLMDCTYKTNKFSMPLLHIVGINNCSKTFSIAFCFISQEQTRNYTWALQQLDETLDFQKPSVIVTDKEQALINAIEEVYPNSSHLLCLWHIFKNIQTNCCKHFKSEDDWMNF